MILPLRDKDALNFFPVMTSLLIGANALIFVYEVGAAPHTFQLFVNYGLIPLRVTQALSWGAGLTFITSQFLHGGFWHLFGNMLYLWIFGNNIEARLGSFGFLAYYLMCGFIAGFAHVLAYPTSPVPVIGASGAIAGVLGAYAITFPNGRIRTLFFLFFFKFFDVRALTLLGIWFVLQLFNGLGSRALGSATGVAYWAHIGGFALGVGFMALYNRLDEDWR